jgi:hypothetical protein
MPSTYRPRTVPNTAGPLGTVLSLHSLPTTVDISYY